MQKPKLTDEQLLSLKEYVEQAALDRKKTLGDDAHLVDFCLGAAAVYYWLEQQDRIPPLWILGPMTGREPVAISEQEKS